jgi:hypothetical protein
MYVSQVVYFSGYMAEIMYVGMTQLHIYYITVIPKCCTLREDQRIERQQISTWNCLSYAQNYFAGSLAADVKSQTI